MFAHLLLIYSSLCKCFYLKSYAFHVSKLYVYRDGVIWVLLVDAKLACVMGEAHNNLNKNATL